MKKELLIKSLKKENCRLTCCVQEPDRECNIWVEVEDDFSSFLCDDRADGMFVICLYRAIKEGYDLRSLVPVSERLYYQTTSFMLNFYSEIFGKKRIKIDVPIISTPLPQGEAVGTGISCGVDSLYTVLTHSNLPSSSFNVTHLVLMNVGAYHISAEDPMFKFKNEVDRARKFCDRYGYSFVKIDSNIREYLPYPFTEYHGIVNGSTLLCLQSLFKTYYSSSSYRFSEFKVNPLDLSQVELFNLSVLSTDNTTFYSTGGDVTRFEKVKALSKWEPSFDTLHVCNSHSVNCCDVSCVKCCRTLVELDVIGALDNFKSVFDVNRFRENISDYLSELWVRKIFRHDHYAIEMWPEISRKYKIPFLKKMRAIRHFLTVRFRIYNWKQIKQLLSLR